MSVIHGYPPSAIRPSMLLLPVLGTVCPNMSRPHPLCLFSEVASRLSSSGVPSHDFYRNICSSCAVTVVIFGHLNRSSLLTCLPVLRFCYVFAMCVKQLFIGLGFPYEGPAPLEAIAQGCVFINPRFSPPHSSLNTKFFTGKPTLRQVISVIHYKTRQAGLLL